VAHFCKFGIPFLAAILVMISAYEARHDRPKRLGLALAAGFFIGLGIVIVLRDDAVGG
jgi:hypothetical protein